MHRRHISCSDMNVSIKLQAKKIVIAVALTIKKCRRKIVEREEEEDSFTETVLLITSIPS